ncbi:hypothetical protein BB561_001019 [Smittium simulii]|uniref:Nucleoside phosphatase GDA1/CD39 n=1 Tax=Smittium simulii TaxID=133385 RepID=A0A2T9YWG9_9FUNG|nr:hypothetical protein BB561_001019 [Smittium simulii]
MFNKPKPSFYYHDLEINRSTKDNNGGNKRQNRDLAKWWEIEQDSVVKNAPKSSDDNNARYGIIIDSGSSQSRLMIYSWTDVSYTIKSSKLTNDLNKLPEINLGVNQDKTTFSHRISPGISTYGDKISSLNLEHLTPMLEFALKTIPKHKHKQTPIYLMATAGMRLLDIQIQNKILLKACEFFKKNSKFYIENCKTHFRVITGEEEGAYGWISVNYLKTGFLPLINTTNELSEINQNSPEKNIYSETKIIDSNTKKIAEPISDTFGFLDMGGASTQIAFKLSSDISAEHSEEVTKTKLKKLNGDEIPIDLFVSTFLGYGTNEARRRYVELLTKESPEVTTFEYPVIADPCLPSGVFVQVKSNNYVLMGSGNLDHCIKQVSTLLNKKKTCVKLPCLIDGVHFPTTNFKNMQFLGVSEYWYASNDILKLGGMWDMFKFISKARDFCATNWETSKIQHINTPGIIEDRIRLQCFKAAWLITILHEGFGILPELFTDSVFDVEAALVNLKKMNHKPNFHSVDTIESKEASWTLGAIILKVSESIPPTSITKSNRVSDFILPRALKSLHKVDDEDLIDSSVWVLSYSDLESLVRSVPL